MNRASYARHLPRGFLIALAPFLLLHIALGIADSFRSDKPTNGYTIGRDAQSIVAVQPEGPAEHAGLRVGDRILEINGVPVARLDELIRSTAAIRVGERVRYRVARGDETIETSLVMGALAPEARFHAATVAATGLAFLAVGLLVVLKRPDTMAIVFYSLTLVFAFLFAPVPTNASLIWNLAIKILYDLCFLLLPALFLHFFLIFPYRVRAAREHPRLVPAIYATSLALFAAGAALDVLYLAARRFELLPGIRLFAAISAILIVIGLFVGIASFVRSYLRTPPGNVRRRLTGVLWGTLLGILPVVLLAVAKSIDQTVTLPGARYYHVSLFLVPLSFAYAIVRYGLMDLEIILKRSLLYTVLTALLAAIYLLVVEGIGNLALAGRGEESLFLKIASIFVMAIVFSPVRTRVQALVDRTFYRDRVDSLDTLRDVSEELTGMIELEALVDRLARRITEVLRVSGVSVFLENKDSGTFFPAAAVGDGMSSAGCYAFGPRDQVVEWAREQRGVLPIERLHESVRWNRLPRGEKQALRQLGAALLLPLVVGDALVGFVLVGSKESGEPHSNEEVALLRTVAAQAAVAVDNALLHKESLARARLVEQLSLARKIQENFLPDAPPALPELELAALNVPCEEVGGDYYDFLLVREETSLGLAIGDASGKGIPAALLMASFQAAFHAEAESQPSPARVLERLNQLIIRQSRSERFVTFFYALLDRKTCVLTYANAGHNPPLLARADGSCHALDEAGLLLGVSSDTRYEDAQLSLAPGDVLLLYTDGVTDELSARDEIFGMERLERIVSGAPLRPFGDLLPSIYRAVTEFMGGKPEDDITLLAMRVR
jgi:sigma-B regulation protein RsbU (phosphoserine phosphatase)